MLNAAIKYNINTWGVLSMVFFAMLYSCSDPASKHAQVINTKATIVKQPLDTQSVIHLVSEQPTHAPSSINPHTFNVCKLYAAADTNAKVIRMLPAMMPFTDLGSIEVSGIDTLEISKDDQPASVRMWRLLYYKVKVNGRQGYLRQDDVAKYVFTDTSINTQYYMGIYFNKKAVAFKFRIRKLTLANKIMTDLEVDDVGESEQDIFIIKNTPLKNVSRLIKLVYHQDYCGGGETAILIADANNKLVQLPDNYTSYNDGGGVYSQTTYFAQAGNDGKIALMPDTIGQPFQIKTKLTYPSQLNIPIEDLLVQTLEGGQYFMNDDNERVKLKNGKYKMETPLTLTTTYYQWNGSQAIKLPSKKVVKL